MKHLCDLPATDIAEILKRNWFIAEKLDGSYLRGGIDETGRFYTFRKGKEIYYRVSDWPDMPWSNYLRMAHMVIQNLFEHLLETEQLKPGDWVDFEVLSGGLPNSIQYPMQMNWSLAVNESNCEFGHVRVGKTSLFRPFNPFSVVGIQYATCGQWITDDAGVSLRKVKQESHWNLFDNKVFPYHPLRDDHSVSVRFNQWIHSRIYLCGFPLMVYQYLDLKLNKKPFCIKEEDWKANRKDIIEDIRETREALRVKLLEYCNDLAGLVVDRLSHYQGHYGRDRNSYEGVVVQVGTEKVEYLFKLVDQRYFTKLNKFTHIVRYWLQGGRRPERPCFLTRTAHWPVEKRLARLETLRKRYVLNRHRLAYTGNNRNLSYTNIDLDRRTLLLFAELKQRIKHGWSSFQGESAQDSEGRDS